MRSSLWLIVALSLCWSLPGRAQPVVGSGVGNADLLSAEGSRLYNEKQFEQAKDSFLKSTRVAPTTLPTYLSLARTYFALKDLERACQIYRVYVKNAPESPDREKAQGELDLCERQAAAAGVTAQLSQGYVNLKATFFEALDKGNLMGTSSAGEVLVKLVGSGYAAPDLGDMAGKLARACEVAADGTYQAVTAHQKFAPPDLRKASSLYRSALDFGAAPAKQAARSSFLEGMALLGDGKAFQAEASFDDAAKKDASDTEARFYRALAKFYSGDKAGAIRALEADLPNDPRTGVLKVAVAMEGAPAGAATELEKFLYTRKFKNVP
jgi:tetratricopeptide (TPR) repeat protein